MNIDKSKIKKILCIKFRGIGDVILSTIVFNNLRKDFPDAEIDYLTEAPSKAALEILPFLNEIILFENKGFFGNLAQILKIRKRKYDLIFDFYSNPRTALLTFLSGAPFRAGFPYRGREYAYNLKGPKERDKYHAAQLHLEFLKMLDLSYDSKELFFGLGNDDLAFANDFFNEKFEVSDFIIGLSPSGGWASKKCDAVKFAEIGDAVVNTYSAKILLLWGPGDQDEALEVRKLMKNKVILAPTTDIRKMGALMSRCHLIISNDSGPMHIATALKTPVLSLHGPTDPKLQGPFGEKNEWIRLEDLDCIGCNLLNCPKRHECFMNLPVEKVIEKVKLLISKNNIALPANEKV